MEQCGIVWLLSPTLAGEANSDKLWAFPVVATESTAENRLSQTLLKPSKVLQLESPLAVPLVLSSPGSSLQ